MIKGLITALITPFESGKIDVQSLKKLLRWQFSSGVDGVVVLGSTGEFLSINDEEREEVIRISVSEAKLYGSNVKVIVGTGCSSTSDTLKHTIQAKELGADAVLVVCPYYNKPSQQGIYEHFKLINDNVQIPIIIYNNPGRAVSDISDITIARLSELPNIVALKDSSGNLARPLRLKNMLAKVSNFIQLSGEDETALAFYASGGSGVISVASNIIPKQLSSIHRIVLNGDLQAAYHSMLRYQKIMQLLFCETNPIPVKYSAFRLGIIASPEVRLPLLSLSHPNCAEIDKELKELGII